MSNDRTSHLKTNAYEMVKQYLDYEVSTGRLLTVYEAHTDAAHGTPCLKTEYTYDGTSGRVLKRKESATTWDSSWDI